ncbi:MAG TPA: hypothetical protein VMN57_05510 [Anaerolineales bacterium]|nr:hypothetical protein [Anaerolineales bacterium]
MTTLESLYHTAGKPVPEALANWGSQVTVWCDEYDAAFPSADLTEIHLEYAVYIFDLTAERVTLAYALSVEQLMRRDASRIRGFPNVNASVRAVLGEKAFLADKGHFLGHVSGGILDINLFPQRRELNRGWSEEGKRFRAIERYVAAHPGAFFYHLPRYDDETWIPAALEYGVLMDDKEWWVERFRNK